MCVCVCVYSMFMIFHHDTSPGDPVNEFVVFYYHEITIA